MGCSAKLNECTVFRMEGQRFVTPLVVRRAKKAWRPHSEEMVVVRLQLQVNQNKGNPDGCPEAISID